MFDRILEIVALAPVVWTAGHWLLARRKTNSDRLNFGEWWTAVRYARAIAGATIDELAGQQRFGELMAYLLNAAMSLTIFGVLGSLLAYGALDILLVPGPNEISTILRAVYFGVAGFLYLTLGIVGATPINVYLRKSIFPIERAAVRTIILNRKRADAEHAENRLNGLGRELERSENLDAKAFIVALGSDRRRDG